MSRYQKHSPRGRKRRKPNARKRRFNKRNPIKMIDFKLPIWHEDFFITDRLIKLSRIPNE